MRSAFESQPSVMGARVIVTVIFLAAAIAVLGYQGKSFDEFVIGSEVWPQKPWLFVTTTLIHGSALHLIFNLYWMWGLGAQVEEQYGSLKTLGFFLLFALVPIAAEWGLFGSAVGLSGVVYGFFGMRWALSRYHPAHRAAMPEQLVQLMVAWFFLCIALTYFDVFGVANMAHGVGGLIGYLAGWALSPSRASDPRLVNRTAGSTRWAVVAACAGLFLAAGTVSRRTVNLSPVQRLIMQFDEGVLALQDGDLDAARRAFERVTQMNERESAAWFNLGLANEALGRSDAALKAYRRALALEPNDEKYRRKLEDWPR